MRYIIEGMKVTGIKVPPPNERVLKIILSPELENSDKFTLLFSIKSPGNATGIHYGKHESDEVMYVATGRGKAMVGEEKKEIKEDTVIFAPKLVKHDLMNTGDGILKLICFYIPHLRPGGYFKEALDAAARYFKSLQ